MQLWLGNKYIFPEITVLFLTLNCAINIFRTNIEMHKNALGYYSDIHLPILETIITCIVAIILGKFLGVLGIILGSTISSILISLIYKPYLLYKNALEKSGWNYIKDYAQLLLLTLIMLAVSISIYNLLQINVNSWTSLVISAGSYYIIILITTAIIFLIDKNYREFFTCTYKSIKKSI